MISCHPEDEKAYLRGILQSLEAQGSAIEVGVYQGGTAQIIKEELPDREIHLFDTFGGIMSEHAEPNWKTGDYRSSLEDVKKNIGEGFIFHTGDVCKTKEEFSGQLAFIHIDLDVYEPLSKILNYFYSQLSKGGVMLISNYDMSHPGVRKAVDEFDKPYKRYSRYMFIRK